MEVSHNSAPGDNWCGGFSVYPSRHLPTHAVFYTKHILITQVFTLRLAFCLDIFFLSYHIQIKQVFDSRMVLVGRMHQHT